MRVRFGNGSTASTSAATADGLWPKSRITVAPFDLDDVEPARGLLHVAVERLERGADRLVRHPQRLGGGGGGEDVLDLEADPAAGRQRHTRQAIRTSSRSPSARTTDVVADERGPAPLGAVRDDDRVLAVAGEVEDRALAGLAAIAGDERVGRVQDGGPVRAERRRSGCS